MHRVIRSVQEGSGGPGRLELDVTHQFLVYADVVDILGESKPTVNQNTGNLLVVNREIIIEVSAEETKCIFMSHEHTTKKC